MGLGHLGFLIGIGHEVRLLPSLRDWEIEALFPSDGSSKGWLTGP